MSRTHHSAPPPLLPRNQNQKNVLIPEEIAQITTAQLDVHTKDNMRETNDNENRKIKRILIKIKS